MTCIIAVKDIENKCVWVGGDSCVSSPVLKYKTMGSKVYKLKDNKETVVATTGAVQLRNIMSVETGIIDEIDILKDNVNFETMVKKVVRNIFKLFVVYNATICINGKHKMDGEILFTHKDKIYEIYNDFAVNEPMENYSANGCGFEFAYGSLAQTEGTDMSPKDRIIEALLSAEKNGKGVERPFKIMNTKDDEIIIITDKEIKEFLDSRE